MTHEPPRQPAPMTAAAPPVFTASMPEYYDTYLGPSKFDTVGAELVKRLPPRPAGDVLELACGTGLVTRRLREKLDPSLRLVATDISKPMLDYARGKYTAVDGIEWREADAMKLPFGDAEFGLVACALGAMFMPDKSAFYREARRVLKPGGMFLFSVWDRLEENLQDLIATEVIAGLFPGEKDVSFLTPFTMHDMGKVRSDLEEAGFRDVHAENVRLTLDHVSARTIAVGQMRGTPRGLLLEKKGFSLDEVADKVTDALARAGGADPFVGRGSIFIVTAARA